MSRDIINTTLLALSFLSLFGVAELLYYKCHVKAELTRKLVHIGTGFLTLLFPVLLHNQWLVLLLCATFALIILASLRFHFLKSINGIDRKSHGSISYPVAVYGCYLVYDYYARKNAIAPDPYLYFYLPILTLAICDPVAALAGKNFPYGRFTIGSDTKTLVGSSAFFVSSFTLGIVLFLCFAHGVSWGLLLPVAVLIAALAAVSEALSGKGIDNITIPATVVIILVLFFHA